MRKIIFISIFLLCIIPATGLLAQDGFMIAGFRKNIPQASLLNPAFIPEKRIYIGLPFISYNHFKLSNRFSLDDIIKRETGDSLQLHPEALLPSLHKNNRLTVKTSTALFYAGFRLLGGYLSFSGDLITDVNFSYSKEFFQLLIQGNGAPDVLGREIQLDKINFNAAGYSKTGVSYARPFLNGKLSLGMKLNYLKGYLNAEVDPLLEGYFRTDPSDFHLKIGLSDAKLNTAGFGLFDNSYTVQKQFFSSGNRGVSVDVGAVYSLNERSDVFVSLLDMGFIKWRADVKNYRIKDGNYDYSGIDFEHVDDVENLLDSLKEIFDPVEMSESYTTSLATSLVAGYSYQVGTIHTIDVIFNSQAFRKDLRFGIGLGYTINIGKLMLARLNYTFLNYKPDNIGLGTVFNFGPVNIFVMSNNFPFILKPVKSRYADVKLGINLAFK